MSPATAERLVFDVLLIALIAIPIVAAFSVATLIFVLPGSALRLAMGRGDEHAATKAAMLRQALRSSRPLGFARRIMAHEWSAAEVVVCCVFILTLSAGVLAILVAGYVLGIARPTFADQALPRVLGASLAVGMAYAWEKRKTEPWLAAVVLFSGTVSIIAMSLMKVEATVTDPATYVSTHPLKDILLAPTWIAVEIGAFAACSLAGGGLAATLHALGGFIGLLIEIAVAGLNGLVWLIEIVMRGLLVIGSLLIGLVLTPGEFMFLMVRLKVGTDLDGRYHLQLPSGGLLTEHAAATSAPRTERRNRN